MKIKVFKTKEERLKLFQWHKKFAWFPVIIDGYVVWLQDVWTKKDTSFWDVINLYAEEDPRPTEEAASKVFRERVSIKAKRVPKPKTLLLNE